MPLVRMLVQWKKDTDPAKEVFTNTLYFNVSGSVDQPDYQALCNDLSTIYSTGFTASPPTAGRRVTVKAYNMDDAEPRPIKAQATKAPLGTAPGTAGQVALCLSYYADRNLPRQRGRIYLGPMTQAGDRPTTQQMASLVTFAGLLAGLGGVNVDWSLWSPTTQQHTRINHGWVDDSWDIIRSRKLAPSARTNFDVNG